MKIVIDTKEDIHILKHVIQLLHAVSTATAAKQKYGYDSGVSMFDSPSSASPSTSTPPVTDATPLFSMFDTPSSSASTSSSSDSFSQLFPGMTEEKKDNNGKTRDFIDSLEVY